MLALHDNGFVQMHPIRPENAPDVLAMQLPDVPAGKGASINVHASEINTHQPGKASPSIALRQLLAQPRKGTAKLYTARRNGEGRQRAKTFLTTIDFETAAGSSSSTPTRTTRPGCTPRPRHARSSPTGSNA